MLLHGSHALDPTPSHDSYAIGPYQLFHFPWAPADGFSHLLPSQAVPLHWKLVMRIHPLSEGSEVLKLQWSEQAEG